MRRDPRGARPRRRPRSSPFRLAAISLVALAGWALAFDPAVGTELLLADAQGNTLIGYGRVAEDGLRLQLSGTTRELRIVVVAPDGRAESYRGLLVDGRLTILDEEGAPTDVADVLARERRTLTLAPEGEEAVVVPPSAGPTVAGEAGAGGDAAASDPSGSGDAAAASERPGRSGDAPGRSGEAPGRSDEAPGPSGDAPGRSGDAPGRSGDAPGRSGDAPGRSGDAPGRSGDAPGRSGDAPGRSGDAPGRSNGAPGGGNAEDGDDGASSGGSVLGLVGAAGEAAGDLLAPVAGEPDGEEGDVVDLVDPTDGGP